MNFNEIYDNKSAGPKLKTNPKYNQIFQICFLVTLWQSKKGLLHLTKPIESDLSANKYPTNFLNNVFGKKNF